MQFGHRVLVVSVIFGIFLQLGLSFFSFELKTLLFIALNLTIPFWILYRVEKPIVKIEFQPIISFKALSEVVLLVLLVYPAINCIGNWASVFLRNPIDQVAINKSFLLFIGFVILAPVLEELFFRGYLLSTYEKKNIQYPIFWTSLWFALYHLNFHQGLYTFFLALILAQLMLNKRNIIYPILLHGGINGLSYWQAISQSNSINKLQMVFSSAVWPLCVQVFYVLAVFYGIYYVYSGKKAGRPLMGRLKLKLDLPLLIFIFIFCWNGLNAGR